MNRIWLGRLLLVPLMVAIYFAADRHFLGLKPGAINLILSLIVAIIIVVQARRRRLPETPAYLRVLPLGKLIMLGAALVLLGFAWLFGCLFMQPQSAYTIVVPFFVPAIAGTAISGACLGLLALRALLDRYGGG